MARWAESQHALNEAAAIHAPVLHLVDHGSQFVVRIVVPVRFWCGCGAAGRQRRCSR
jgi:hypothetical protein